MYPLIIYTNPNTIAITLFQIFIIIILIILLRFYSQKKATLKQGWLFMTNLQSHY